MDERTKLERRAETRPELLSLRELRELESVRLARAAREWIRADLEHEFRFRELVARIPTRGLVSGRAIVFPVGGRRSRG